MRFRYVAFGEESAHGTAVQGTAVIDPESTSMDAPEDQALIWSGASGLQRQVAAGPYSIDGDVSALLDEVVSGWYWKWLLGAYATVGTVAAGGLTTSLTAAAAAGATAISTAAVTNAAANDYVQVGTGDTAEVHKIQTVGVNSLTLASPLRFAHASAETVKEVTAPFTHTFSHDGRPTLVPFTTRVGKDLFEHIFSGCVMDEIEVSVEDGFVKVSLKVLASKDTKGALPAASQAFTEGAIFAAHQVTIMINNVDSSTKVEQLKLTAGNNAELGRAVGSRFPNRGYRGEFAVTGEATLAFNDTAELERYWGGAAGPTTTSLTEFPIAINIGPNVDLVLPRVIYTAAGQPVEGPDRIHQKVSFTSLLDAAADGPLQVVMVNNQAEYGA